MRLRLRLRLPTVNSRPVASYHSFSFALRGPIYPLECIFGPTRARKREREKCVCVRVCLYLRELLRLVSGPGPSACRQRQPFNPQSTPYPMQQYRSISAQTFPSSAVSGIAIRLLTQPFALLSLHIALVLYADQQTHNKEGKIYVLPVNAYLLSCFLHLSSAALSYRHRRMPRRSHTAEY